MADGVTPIYIAGRAHSGSTILTVILNGHPQIQGCGEVLDALARGPHEECSCGAKIRECPQWSQVFTAYRVRSGRDLEEDIPKLYELTDIRQFGSALRSKPEVPDDKWSFYAQATRDLNDTIADVFDVSAFVDSHKEYTRGLMMLRSDPSAKVIHIYREPDITITSHYYRLGAGSPVKFMKRLYRPGLMTFPFLMVIALGWSVGMIAAILTARAYPDRVLHLSHDDFSANPVRELERIGAFLNIDLSVLVDTIRNGRYFAIEHVIGGNEFKHEGRITFDPRTKGRRKAPWYYRAAAWLFAWPGALARRFFIPAPDYALSDKRADPS